MYSNPRGLPRQLHPLLVLGRVSNLPTVWSNCLAAWIIAGGGGWGALIALCCGASLLYTSGMFLNDAFDVEFDRQFRPERPIIAGQISHRTVLGWGAGMLLLGWGLLWVPGTRSGLFASLLVGLIVIYDAVHKRTSLSPALMAGCRFLLYLVAAAAAQNGTGKTVVAAAAALALYILGLSCLARVESTSRLAGRGPYALLFTPIAAAFIFGTGGSASAVPATALAGWVLWCVLAKPGAGRQRLGRGVSGLLAGITLVDLLAAGPANPWLWVPFVVMFALALSFQRFAPAT